MTKIVIGVDRNMRESRPVPKKAKVGIECRLCLGPCDPEIHRATERIHEYIRERVQRDPRPIEQGKQTKRPSWGSGEIR